MAAALSRSAAGADSVPPSEFLPVPPAPIGPEVTPSRGFLRHEGRLLGWVLALVAVAAVLVTVGLTLAKDDLSGLFGPETTRQRPGGGSSATTTPRATIPVATAVSFDPFTDDPEKKENEELADRAIDPNRESFWRTEGYNQNFAPGGFKEGVGLVLDLGRAREVGQLNLTLNPVGGSELAVYGSNDPRPPTFPEGWTELRGPETYQGTAKFDLEGNHQYLLVWFSSLPQDVDGKYRGGIADVRLTS
jgi:hypothetical protein